MCKNNSLNKLMEEFLLTIKLFNGERGRRSRAWPLLTQQKLGLRPVVLDRERRGSLDHAQSWYRVHNVWLGRETCGGSNSDLVLVLEEGGGGMGKPCH